MKSAIVAAVLAATGLVATPVPAQQAEAAKPRPKVVLVLSGGGARGAAHIGVLKVLEEYHVPFDMIVGTSMGAIVGGLYAAGWSVEEIESKVGTIDWGAVFVDQLPRQAKTFHRKEEDSRFLVPLKMRFKNWKPYLPPAILGGQSMELLFQGLEIEATGMRDFDRFPVPFRAVAADLSTGEAVVIGKGSLAKAMRASMALPGILPPVDLDGRPLADGGVAANFPIRIAKGLGGEVIVGVDITSPLRGKEELGNLLKRIDQATNLLTNANRVDDMKAVGPDDVILVPDLGEVTFLDLERTGETIAAGEAAARAAEARLRALSVSDEAWAAFEARHHRRPVEELVVDEVRLQNTGPLADDVVRARLDVPLGVPLDEADLAKRLTGLYGLDTFGPIRHDLVHEDGRGVLIVETPKKPYGRHSLQFGFFAADDFRGDTAFNLAFSHLFSPFNRRGGEWRNVVQVGDNDLAGTEYYQPLDARLAWFFEARAVYRRDNVRLQVGDALTAYRFANQDAYAGFGRVLSSWGSIAVGAFRSHDDGRPKLGPALLPVFSTDDGGISGAFKVDTLDSVTWPRHGVLANVAVLRSISSFGADGVDDTIRCEVASAASIGRNVLFASVEAQRGSDLATSFRSSYRLGGFLRISGLAQDELIGTRGGLMRLLYYRELTRFDLGSLTQRMYAGISFEAGSVYGPLDPVSFASLRRAGSIYAGADTVIGPVYLGFGYAEGGQKSVYLIIGQRF